MNMIVEEFHDASQNLGMFTCSMRCGRVRFDPFTASRQSFKAMSCLCRTSKDLKRKMQPRLYKTVVVNTVGVLLKAARTFTMNDYLANLVQQLVLSVPSGLFQGIAGLMTTSRHNSVLLSTMTSGVKLY